MKMHHNQKVKKIIGLIGDNKVCQEVSEFLVKNGFYVASISNKVSEIAKYLIKLKEDEITDELITKIRNKGYQVNKLYWINLVLTSVPENKNLIVIEDLRIEDVIKDIITPYYFTKNDDGNNCPKDIKMIVKPNDSDEFKRMLEKEFKR